MFLYAISGVDGSGKSTFASEIVGRLSVEAPELSVCQLWLRYTPRQTGGSTVQSTVSVQHRGHPAKRALRSIGLRSLWVTANACIYRRQLLWQLAAVQAHVIIADRFVLDFIVDQVVAGMLDVEDVASAMRRLPKPDAAVQLDVDDQELRRRLKPGDDGDRVLANADCYRTVARALSIPVVDSRQTNSVSDAIDAIFAVTR
jgi:thymidylate kinase